MNYLLVSRGQLLQEWICSSRCKLFPVREDLSSGKTCFWKDLNWKSWKLFPIMKMAENQFKGVPICHKILCSYVYCKSFDKTMCMSRVIWVMAVFLFATRNTWICMGTLACSFWPVFERETTYLTSWLILLRTKSLQKGSTLRERICY